MASHEMQVIKELDISLLTKHEDRLHFYFADEDDWVGRYRAEILESFQSGSVKVVLGQKGIPHAFCISKY
jgi:hypothetical protein